MYNSPNEDISVFKNYLESHEYDYINMRTPYYSGLTVEQIKMRTHVILENKKQAHLIDNITSYEDVSFEDKYKIDFNKHFIKKKFSVRADGL